MHTVAAAGARAAIGNGKLDLHQVAMVLAAERGPTAAGVSLRTSRLPVFPIEHKLARINALRGPSLPLRINGRRTNHLDPKALVTVDQHPSTHVASIHAHVLLVVNQPGAPLPQ